MKTSDDKWLEQIRKAVDGAEATPSDGLWERIESDLPAAVPPTRRRLTLTAWRAVAAAACLAIVAGAYYLTTRDGKPTAADASAIAASSVPEKSAATTTPATDAVTASELVAMARTEAEPTLKAAPAAEPASLVSVDDEPVCTETPADSAARRIGTLREFIKAVPTQNVDKHDNYGSRQPSTASTREKTHRWHIALAADNDFGQGRNASAGGFAPLYLPMGYSSLMSAGGVSAFEATYLKATSNNIDEPTETDEITSFPISYSATFRYMLTDRWGINAGLSYTSASSERRSGSATDYYSTKTRMHYVGVPVTVSYTFFASRYVSLYALAGGSVEKCVKATRKDFVVASGREMTQASRHENLDQRPWQGSLNAGAGVQLNITPRYGIFAEPQLVYDLSKDSATPAPRRNDFSFNLAVGVRMSY